MEAEALKRAFYEWKVAKEKLEKAKRAELKKRLLLVRAIDGTGAEVGNCVITVKQPTYLKPKDQKALMARIDEMAAQGAPVKELFDFKVSVRAKYKTHPMRVMFEDLIVMSTGTPQVSVKEKNGE